MAKWIFAIGGGLFSLGGAVAMSFGALAYPDYAFVLTWGGIIAAAIGGVVMLLTFRSVFATEDSESMGDTYNNSGNNFGHMGPINFRPPPRELTEENIAALKALLPDGRTWEVCAIIGDLEAAALARTIHTRLVADGYKTSGSVHLIPPVDVVGIQVVHGADPGQIIVGPNG